MKPRFLCLGARAARGIVLAILAGTTSALAADITHLRGRVAALGELQSPPVIHPAEGVAADGPTLSSELQPVTEPAAPRVTATVPGFSWDRVPLNLNLGQRNGELIDAEIDFIATHGTLIALEKSPGLAAHGSTEAGIAATARRSGLTATREFTQASVFVDLNTQHARIDWR